jgi:hypothetical protein
MAFRNWSTNVPKNAFYKKKITEWAGLKHKKLEARTLAGKFKLYQC